MVSILQRISRPTIKDEFWKTIGKALSEQDALSVLPLLPEGKYKIVDYT
jgi:hypothetical protein